MDNTLVALAGLAVAAAGCSQHVYSPPAQAFSMNGIRSLDANQQALDLEASRHQQIFDPGVLSGGARFRAGLGDNTEGSLEGAVYGVESGGPSQADHRVFVGRAGVRTNPMKGPFALFGGVGGGYAPAGGDFITADGGIAVGYVNCTLVPMAAASAFVSDPMSPRPIDVTDDPKYPSTSTPRLTFGSVVRVGLRISLSPSSCRAGNPVPWITIGGDVTTLVDYTSHANLGGAGIGIEIPL